MLLFFFNLSLPAEGPTFFSSVSYLWSEALMSVHGAIAYKMYVHTYLFVFTHT